MEDHLIVSSDEQKVLKKFKTRLEKRHHVVINMPDTVEFSESDVIFVSIVGEKYNIENVKKFLSERMKTKKEKIECQSNVVLITLSDSEDSVSSDSESKENSVCVVEELGSNYRNLVKKSTVCNSLDNSVLIIDCPEDSSKTNIITLQNVNKRKRKSKQERLRNKKARIKDILTTNEAEVCEISSTLEACEVSSTTEETIKQAQPVSEKLADFIPLGPKKEKKQISAKKCGIVEKKGDIILLEEPVSAPRPLRPIVIDGSNVAMEHGKVSHCFSAKGIQLAVEYFLKRGHTDVHAFVPKFRRISNPHHNFPTKDPEILDELAKQQHVVFTPSRRVNGKCIASYDDRFIVDLASRNGGVIVSNDNYRDLIGESDSFKESIEKRLLMFCFVGDIFMIPSDPLGRNGPSLEEFLSFPPESQT